MPVLACWASCNPLVEVGMPGHSPRLRMASSRHAWMGCGLLVIGTPTLVSAAAADAHPRFGSVLFGLAVLETISIKTVRPTMTLLRCPNREGYHAHNH